MARTTESKPSALKRPKTTDVSHADDGVLEPRQTLITLFENPDSGPISPASTTRLHNRPVGGMENSQQHMLTMGVGPASLGPTMFGEISRSPDYEEARPGARSSEWEFGAVVGRGKGRRESKPMEEDSKRNRGHIRVYLQRQIVVTVRGQKVVKTMTCGDG